MMNNAKLFAEVQAAILAQRRPLVVQLDVELPDGQLERVAIGTGRYRAKEAATTVVALQGVSMRLLAKDGSVLRAMRLQPEVAASAAPTQAQAATETDMDRAMRIVGEIYVQAHRQATEAAAQAAAAAATERELATAGMTRAIEIMAQSVDRASAQLVELHERERETSTREVEAAATAAAAESAGPAAATAAIMRELPAAMPALVQFAQLAQGLAK